MRREGYSSCLVCVSVCMYVGPHTLFWQYAQLYRSITKDAIVLSARFAAILKRRFSQNDLIRKLSVFYPPRQGRPSIVDAYSACNVSYILSVTCLLTRKALRFIIPD